MRRRGWRWDGWLRSAAWWAIRGSEWRECFSHSGACFADEQRLGRMLDYAVIVPRLQHLYEWSSGELADPRVLGLVRDGNPIYAWPFEERHVWRTRHMPFAARVLEHVTRPSTQTRAFRA